MAEQARRTVPVSTGHGLGQYQRAAVALLSELAHVQHSQRSCTSIPKSVPACSVPGANTKTRRPMSGVLGVLCSCLTGGASTRSYGPALVAPYTCQYRASV
eukprot:879521-Rhodomonas_salina.4